APYLPVHYTLVLGEVVARHHAPVEPRHGVGTAVIIFDTIDVFYRGDQVLERVAHESRLAVLDHFRDGPEVCSDLRRPAREGLDLGETEGFLELDGVQKGLRSTVEGPLHLVVDLGGEL